MAEQHLQHYISNGVNGYITNTVTRNQCHRDSTISIKIRIKTLLIKEERNERTWLSWWTEPTGLEMWAGYSLSCSLTINTEGCVASSELEEQSLILSHVDFFLFGRTRPLPMLLF